MARCPFAEWIPIPPQESYASWKNQTYAEQEQTQLILHSAVGSYTGSIAWWEKQFKWGIYSTFFVLNNGTLIQLIDSKYKSVANSTANARAISVETEDYMDPDHRLWTPAQVETLVKLAKWVHDEHGIPLTPCAEHDEPGIGFHAMWSDRASVNPWISETKKVKAKTCPGIVRIPQFFNEIMAGVGYPLRGTETDEVFARWSHDPRKKRPTLPKKKSTTKKKRKKKSGGRAWHEVERPRSSQLATALYGAPDEPAFTRSRRSRDDDVFSRSG